MPLTVAGYRCDGGMMRDARWVRFLLLLALFPAGCESEGDFVRLEPPADEGIYSYANGCFALEGFDGENAPIFVSVTPSTQAFTFSEPNQLAATRFRMRASDLGTYLFYDENQHYLTAEPDAAGGWQFARTETLESPLTLLDVDFVSPAAMA